MMWPFHSPAGHPPFAGPPKPLPAPPAKPKQQMTGVGKPAHMSRKVQHQIEVCYEHYEPPQITRLKKKGA